MVFSSRTWKALCSFQSAETAVMSPELRTGRCPSLQPLRAIKSRVPTSVTGEFPGSRRQGCVAALRRGGNAVAGGLREKNHTNMKPHQTLNTFIYPTCLLGIWVWRKYYGPRLFLGSKSCLCWDNILLSVGSITKLSGDLYRWKGSDTRGRFVYCAELQGGGGKEKLKAGNDADFDFCHRPPTNTSHRSNVHCAEISMETREEAELCPQGGWDKQAWFTGPSGMEIMGSWRQKAWQHEVTLEKDTNHCRPCNWGSGYILQ